MDPEFLEGPALQDAFVDPEIDEEGGVGVLDALYEVSDRHAHAEFFVQLPGEGLLVCLSRLDLPARELPVQAVATAGGALGKEDAVAVSQEAADDDKASFGGAQVSLGSLSRACVSCCARRGS